MKFEEISKELNIPLWKIKNIYFSGINKLKKRIKEDPTLRKELEELLKDININTTHGNKELLEEILYDSYGRSKY